MPPDPKPGGGGSVTPPPTPGTSTGQGPPVTPGLPGLGGGVGAPKAHSFHGKVNVNASTAKLRLVQIAEEMIAVLAADPNAEVKASVEIQATGAVRNCSSR